MATAINEPEIVDHADDQFGSREVNAIAGLPPDMAILKLENDSIQSLALTRPRDFEAIKQELETQLKAFPQLAEDAIYSKPVGKDPNTHQQRFARGLSVRSAETLAECYGYNRVRVDVTNLDENTVKVEATFTDYQRGRIWQDAGIVSKFYKARSGSMQRIPDDRFYSVTVKAEASRRVREVILRSVSPGLKAWYEDQIEKTMKKLVNSETLDGHIAFWSRQGVSEEQLERFIGRPRSAGWTEEDMLNLKCVWNGIKQGETTVADAFEKKNENKATNGTVRGSDLASPKEAKSTEQESDQSQSANGSESSTAGQSQSDGEPDGDSEQPVADAHVDLQMMIGEEEASTHYVARLKEAAGKAESRDALDAILSAAVQASWDRLDKPEDQYAAVERAVERRRAALEADPPGES